MQPMRGPSGAEQDGGLDRRLALVSTTCALMLAALAATRVVTWLWTTIGLRTQDVLSRASWIGAADQLFGDGFLVLVLLLALGSAARHLAMGATLSHIERAGSTLAIAWGTLGIVSNIGAASVVVHSWQTGAEAAGIYEDAPGWAAAGFVATAALSAVLVWGAQQLLRSGSTPTESARKPN